MLRGGYAKIYEKNLLSDFLVDEFMENHAISPSLRGIGFKDRNFRGIFLGKEVPKTIFFTNAVNTAA
jgi:hypothetical protein